MNNLEFGFDSGENLIDDLTSARATIDKQALDNDHRYLGLPVSHEDVTSGVEAFVYNLMVRTPSLAARLFKLDQVRRAIYGTDSVATVQTHPAYGVTINDYELHEAHRICGDHFQIIDLKKDNRANSFLLVNIKAARNIMERYSEDFDELTKRDPMIFIQREIAKPLIHGKEPVTTLQHGLLSGFPRESVRLYAYFDSFRKQFPIFHDAYTKFLLGEISSNDVYEVIQKLPIQPKDRKFLLQILAEHARFNDRSTIMSGQCIMLTTEDLHYTQRREQWFRYFDSIYKPIIQSSRPPVY